MTSPPQSDRAGMPRRRKLNQPLIKSVIVVAAAGFTAAVSAVTGIGAHLAFAPMLTWMFGYHPEKAQGTALRFSLFAALATIITYFWLQDHAFTHVTRGLFLVIGATLGALAAAPMTPKPTAIGARRALQAVAIIAAIFTVTEAIHLTEVTRSNAHYAHWSAWWQLLLLGLVVGAITQAARLVGGALLVPALYFLTAIPDVAAASRLRSLTASDAVIESLIVVFLASLLPAWGYSQRKLVDPTYVFAAVAGGILGGLLGGWLDTILLERTILVIFGLVAMFFSAREIARLAAEQPVLPASETEDRKGPGTEG